MAKMASSSPDLPIPSRRKVVVGGDIAAASLPGAVFAATPEPLIAKMKEHVT
jgi:hypothetical protein